MGSYELRDLDHIGAGYLYEGKLIIDKTWGHGYYGCAGCCYYTNNQLNPSPNAGGVGTGANNYADAFDECSSSWEDVTWEAYNWASSNSRIVNLTNAYSSLVSVGSALGSANVELEAHARNCPVQARTPQNTQTTYSLSCSPTSVTRASTVTCKLQGSGSGSWTFKSSDGTISVNGPSSATSWSGAMVIGGPYPRSWEAQP